MGSRLVTPLEERAIAQLGPRQYAIEGDGFLSSPDEDSVWHVDLAGEYGPTCDCPAFISDRSDPPSCKHIGYLQRLEQLRNAAKYVAIFGTD